MDHNRPDSDFEIERNSRVERVSDDMGRDNAGENITDLGRAQADGNLGNERTRTTGDERDRNDRDDVSDESTF